MGIEPFLLSSSLIGVLAQRLVRVLNPETREPFMAGEYERRLLNLDPRATRAALPAQQRARHGLSRSNRHLRTHRGRRSHAHHDS
jgi:type II secretory ATPase GspE/PulE/Tfp pilus assembly ATPase PilB-like protein